MKPLKMHTFIDAVKKKKVSTSFETGRSKKIRTFLFIIPEVAMNYIVKVTIPKKLELIENYLKP